MNVAIQSHPPSVNVILGAQLAHRLPHQPASARSRLAYKLSTGSVILQRPTQAQAARLMGVSESSVSMVAHRARRPNVCPPMSDKAVEALIAKIGAERIMTALDRITAPGMA